jgi:hypothetical protein
MHVEATTIYYDSFTAADGPNLIDRAPDTSNGVAGATWAGPTTVWQQEISSNRALLGADTHVSLDIASSGGFAQPEIIRVSAIMNLGNTAGPTSPDNNETQRGVGLGFYESILSVATNSDFRGLVLGTDGRLVLARAGANGSARAGFLAEIATGIDTSVDHTVSYDINTTTGDISNILLDGVLQADVATTIFNADVNRVGFFASSTSGGTTATYDDFTVIAVPEPTSLALLGLGSLLIARRRRG